MRSGISGGVIPVATAALVALAAAPASAERTASTALASVVVDTGAEPVGHTRQVIIVALDGVRWQDVFNGVDAALARAHKVPEAEVVSSAELLPNIYDRFVRKGAVVGAPEKGEPMLSSTSALSLPGYLELFTGRVDDPCRSNSCAPTTSKTFLDVVRAMPGVGRDDVAAISSWEIIERAATSSPQNIVISAGRHHGWTRDKVRVDPAASKVLDAGARSRAAPGHEDYRPDSFTGELALRYLKARRPRAMFIGLGDTDEYAHANNYRSYLRSMREADAFVGKLFQTLDSMDDYGASTTVVFTADHGRADDFIHHGRLMPESRRVFVMAAGGAVPARGLVKSTTSHRVADIAPTLRSLLGMPADGNTRAGAAIAELLPGPLPPRAERAQASR
jgi:hypothetical protein